MVLACRSHWHHLTLRVLCFCRPAPRLRPAMQQPHDSLATEAVAIGAFECIGIVVILLGPDGGSSRTRFSTYGGATTTSVLLSTRAFCTATTHWPPLGRARPLLRAER